MALKRKHTPEDDYVQSSRAAKKQARLVAELANLADYNKPPEPRSRTRNSRETDDRELSASEDEGKHTLRASRRTCKVAVVSEELRVRGARIAKSQAKVSSKGKRSFGDRLLAEVARLQPWHDWPSEEEDSSSDSDDQDDREPHPHTRHYPPRVPGAQNLPWSELPGEIRNKIYEHAMMNEEEKTLNVVHYPDGVPRRSVRGIASTTNFAHSYWGLTQTCQQIRTEFTKWLLEKRRVRTPLATLSNYIDTFHRPDQDGKRIGWIEPICRGASLPGNGVEVLEMLKYKHANPSFHLQLIPTTVSVVLDYLAPPVDPGEFDELKIVRDMDETFAGWSDNILQTAGIEGVHITSITKDDQSDPDDGEDDVKSHEILIKLDVGQSQTQNTTRDQQLQSVNSFIFASHIAQKQGVKLQASFNGAVARWRVTRPGTVDMEWKERKARGVKTFRRLTFAPDEPAGHEEESLD